MINPNYISKQFNCNQFISISKQKQPNCEKKYAAPKCQGKKTCEIKVGGQEIAVIIVQWQNLKTTIQVNLCPPSSFTRTQHQIHLIVVTKIFAIELISQAATFDFTCFFTLVFWGCITFPSLAVFVQLFVIACSYYTKAGYTVFFFCIFLYYRSDALERCCIQKSTILISFCYIVLISLLLSYSYITLCTGMTFNLAELSPG